MGNISAFSISNAMHSFVPAPDQVFLACGYTDLRLGIDGLVTLVQFQYQIDPYQNILFLFCGRRADRIKGILWCGDGFTLLYKRLSNGRFKWPRSENELLEVSSQQLEFLLEGLSISQKTSIKKIDKIYNISDI